MGKKERKEQHRETQRKNKRKRKSKSHDDDDDVSSSDSDDSTQKRKRAHSKLNHLQEKGASVGSMNQALERLKVIVRRHVEQYKNEQLMWNNSYTDLQGMRLPGLVSAYNGPLPTEEPSEELKLMRKNIGIRVREDSKNQNGLVDDHDDINGGTRYYCPPPLHRDCIQKKTDSKQSSSSVLPKLFHDYFQNSSALVSPTNIQMQVWPAMLSSHYNLLCIAPTGSGKTLAYGLPLIQFVLQQVLTLQQKQVKLKTKKSKVSGKGSASISGLDRKNGPLALVMVPTRELAQQVQRTLKDVSRIARKSSFQDGSKIIINTMAVFGGESRQLQVEKMEDFGFVHVMIATPGRLVDLLADEVFALKNVSCLILDEADKMFNTNFQEEMDVISEAIVRNDRVTCLFSATFPAKLSDACDKWISTPRLQIRASTFTLDLEQPEVVSKQSVKKQTEEKRNTTEVPTFDLQKQRKLDFASIPSNIRQILHVCSSHKKPKKLIKTLTKLREEEEKSGRRNPGLCIVFFNRIKNLIQSKKFLQTNLKNARIAELHGQMPQFARNDALSSFKAGKVHTLLATDVAARGIHINNVAYVVNYDFPGSLEQYVHRCGRAGRSHINKHVSDENTHSNSNRVIAVVYSFFSREFAPMAPDMLELLKKSGSDYIDPNLVSLVEEVESKSEKQGNVESTPTSIKNNHSGSHQANMKSNCTCQDDGNNGDDDSSLDGQDDLDGQFQFLAQRGQVLFKRAQHVSDASSDDSSDDID